MTTRRVRLLTLGLALLSGCAAGGRTVLGAAPAGPARTTAEARTLPAGSDLLLTGEIAEKCPVSGCWFILRDARGTVKVDTKLAGFVVVEVPLHQTVTVAGRTSHADGGRVIDATGLRY